MDGWTNLKEGTGNKQEGRAKADDWTEDQKKDEKKKKDGWTYKTQKMDGKEVMNEREKNGDVDEVLERNRNLNRGFRKLEVWREAIDLYVFVKKALDELKHIPYKIRDQILASTFSISSNISEGYCRKSLKEYIQFINISLGSCGECYTQMFALLKSRDLCRTVFDDFDRRHYGLENKLINLAKTLTERLKTKGDWGVDYNLKNI